jgi:hypothetical protein
MKPWIFLLTLTVFQSFPLQAKANLLLQTQLDSYQKAPGFSLVPAFGKIDTSVQARVEGRKHSLTQTLDFQTLNFGYKSPHYWGLSGAVTHSYSHNREGMEDLRLIGYGHLENHWGQLRAGLGLRIPSAEAVEDNESSNASTGQLGWIANVGAAAETAIGTLDMTAEYIKADRGNKKFSGRQYNLQGGDKSSAILSYRIPVFIAPTLWTGYFRTDDSTAIRQENSLQTGVSTSRITNTKSELAMLGIHGEINVTNSVKAQAGLAYGEMINVETPAEDYKYQMFATNLGLAFVF